MGQSLPTKDLVKAFQKVNQIASIFTNTNTCEQTLLVKKYG